jgi:hypothetical protein
MRSASLFDEALDARLVLKRKDKNLLMHEMASMALAHMSET